jgi:hypothetical protein
VGAVGKCLVGWESDGMGGCPLLVVLLLGPWHLAFAETCPAFFAEVCLPSGI